MNVYDALASAIYVARQNLTGAAIDTDDKRLRASGLYEDWAEGAYTVGDMRNAKGQTWECFQAHDTASNPDITPEDAASPAGAGAHSGGAAEQHRERN